MGVGRVLVGTEAEGVMVVNGAGVKGGRTAVKERWGMGEGVDRGRDEEKGEEVVGRRERRTQEERRVMMVQTFIFEVDPGSSMIKVWDRWLHIFDI